MEISPFGACPWQHVGRQLLPGWFLMVGCIFFIFSLFLYIFFERTFSRKRHLFSVARHFCESRFFSFMICFCTCSIPDYVLQGNTELPTSTKFVDWAMWLKASLAGLSMEVVPMALYKYRRNAPNSLYGGSDSYSGHRVC